MGQTDLIGWDMNPISATVSLVPVTERHTSALLSADGHAIQLARCLVITRSAQSRDPYITGSCYCNALYWVTAQLSDDNAEARSAY